MANISIAQLAYRLETLTDKYKTQRIVEVPMMEMFFWVLKACADSMANDTTYARALFVKGIAEKLGGDFLIKSWELGTVYDYWEKFWYPENKDRVAHNITEGVEAPNGAGGAYGLKIQPGLMQWMTNDIGIINQEYVADSSTKHPRFPTMYHKGFVTSVCSRFDSAAPKNIIDLVTKSINDCVQAYMDNGVIVKP